LFIRRRAVDCKILLILLDTIGLGSVGVGHVVGVVPCMELSIRHGWCGIFVGGCCGYGVGVRHGVVCSCRLFMVLSTGHNMVLVEKIERKRSKEKKSAVKLI
jgi:hypothetical protein